MPPASGPADGGDDASVAALFTRVIADAEQVARAEIDLQKARVLAKVSEARLAILLLVAAIAIGSVVSTAIVVGLLLILAPVVGPVWATVIVAGTLLVLTLALGWLSLRQFKLLFTITGDTP